MLSVKKMNISKVKILEDTLKIIRLTHALPKSTGGNGAKIGIFFIFIFLKSRVKNAAIKVESVPKITSTSPKGLAKFAIKHPIASPGIASGEKTGKIVNISDNLNWTPEYANPKILEINVKTIYKAAIVDI